MRAFLYVIFLALIIIGVTFAYLNATPVIFNYYFGDLSIALSLLLTFALGLGLLFGVLCVLLPCLKLQHKNRKLQKKLQLAATEIENLRSIPIANKI